MSEIRTFIDNQQDLTIHIVSGDLTSHEILDKLKFCYQSAPTTKILWNLSAATWSRIANDELRSTAAGARRYSKKGGRMALVFSRDVDFGLGRMFGVYAEMGGQESEFNSFRNRKEADEWLGIKECRCLSTVKPTSMGPRSLKGKKSKQLPV